MKAAAARLSSPWCWLSMKRWRAERTGDVIEVPGRRLLGFRADDSLTEGVARGKER